MYIRISSKCQGCGICSLLCPSVFEIYRGQAVVNPEYINGKEENCITAMLECPTNAIEVF